MAGLAIVATIPSDSHTWNLVFIELLLVEHGYEVINLGACTPTDLIVSLCQELGPALLVVSTVNGHGHEEGLEIGRALGALPAEARPVSLIGGKLALHGPSSDSALAALRQAGFHAALDGADSLQEFKGILRMLEASHEGAPSDARLRLPFDDEDEEAPLTERFMPMLDEDDAHDDDNDDNDDNVWRIEESGEHPIASFHSWLTESATGLRANELLLKRRRSRG
jgi:methylaspartate mutase sigma subunit